MSGVARVASSRGGDAMVRLASAWNAPSSLLKGGALLCALLVLIWLALPLPWSAPHLDTGVAQANGSALRLYYQAALDVLRGVSPYHAALAWSTTHAPTDPSNLAMDVYTYPPLLALLLLPFTVLPLSVLAAGWMLLSLLSALYLALFLVRLVVPGARGVNGVVATVIALDLVLLFGPLRHSMRGGQIDVTLIALVVAAWHALRARRMLRGALLLGLVIAVKPTYVLLLGFHLWRRDWRVVGTTLAVAAVGIVLPFLLVPHQALSDFLRVSAFWNAPGFLMAPKSISALGVFERMCFTFPGAWPLCAAPWISRTPEIVLGLACYLGATMLVDPRLDRDETHWRYAFGLILMVLLLGSPLTEDAHLALALIPLGVVIAPLVAALRHGERGAVLPLLLAGVIFIYWTLPVRSAASFSTYAGWRALLAGYWFYGLAGLAALYVWSGCQAPYRLAGLSALHSGWRELHGGLLRLRAGAVLIIARLVKVEG